MDPPLDPHHLVALMHKTIGHHHHNVSRHEDVVEKVVGGIIDDSNTNRRTFPILDALASISVSEPRRQVVALALQLRSQERRIRLTIAENDDVKDSLVPYLTRVWGKLRALSDEYAGQRAAGADPQRLDGFRGDSPSIPPDVGLSLRVDIFREIFQYTMQKNQRRGGKWRHRFAALIRQLHKVRGGNLHGLEKELESAFFGLERAYRLLSKQSLTEEDWQRIMAIMSVAADRAKLITEDNWTCEMLANELKDPEPVPFQLRRALEKLTSQHRHFHTLVAFAHSPRLRLAFECDLSIDTVPKSPYQSVQLPSSAAQWKSIIDNICRGNYRGGEDWPDQEAEDLASVFQTPAFSARIHCECALIEYLENNTSESRRGGNAGGSGIAESRNAVSGSASSRSVAGRGAASESAASGSAAARGAASRGAASGSAAGGRPRGRGRGGRGGGDGRGGRESGLSGSSESDDMRSVPAFSYIGVSKLSCSPCRIWINAYNSLGGPKFYTRGSHGKWYWPWRMPSLEAQQLRTRVVQAICHEYIEHQRSHNRLRNAFDSTDASSQGAQVPTDSGGKEMAESDASAFGPLFYGSEAS